MTNWYQGEVHASTHSERLAHALHTISSLAHSTLNTAKIPLTRTLSNLHSTGSTSPVRLHPAFDVIEDDEGYEIYADLPGVQQNDIKIVLISNMAIEISGMIKHRSLSQRTAVTNLPNAGDEIDPNIDGGPCTITHHTNMCSKRQMRPLDKPAKPPRIPQ